MIGIYKITNKINGHAYIGQSVQIEKRWAAHKEKINSDKEKDYPLYRAFKKYGLDNFSFEIIEECQESDLNDREIYWIDYYDTFKNGYNQTVGGSGTRKYNPQDVIDTYNVSKNMNQTAKTLNLSYYTVRDILHHHNIFGIDEIKPVEQIDPKTLKVIKTFESLEDAAREIGCTHTAIAQAAAGQTNNCRGYFWRFKGDKKDFSNTTLNKRWRRGVLQLDKETGEIIQEYLSLSDAAASLNLPSSATSSICAACKGKYKSAYGYKWCYSDE